MKHLLILLTACSFLIVSCEAPPGPEGPQGPKGEMGEQGPPGEDGADGEDGTDGQDGTDGSANVTSFIVSYTASNASFNSSNTIAWVRFNTDVMTSYVAENAAVMAYFDNGPWTALPLSNYSPDVEITYSYQEGLVEVDFYSKDGTSLTANEIPEGRVKFVIIPPSSNAKVNGEDWENRIKTPGLLSRNFN